MFMYSYVVLYYRHSGKRNMKQSKSDMSNVKNRSSNVGRDLSKGCAFESVCKSNTLTEASSLRSQVTLPLPILLLRMTQTSKL